MVQQCSHQRPAQDSNVYMRRQVPPFSAIPPFSPPSPVTPAEDDFSGTPLESLGLTQPDIAVCGKKLAIEDRLARAVHVLATETHALQNLTQLYASDRFARDGFTRAVDAITLRQGNGGKLVVIGVGKSGHIAKKLVATFNSLAIQAVFLHPTEALHGDLGVVSRRDTLLLITFSGKTPELLALLPHLDRSLPLILLTAHARPETCELLRRRPDAILLPAPVHETETTSFGVAAPTTSTTVALTVGDALAMVASRELHADVAAVFARNHPGGAIGAALRRPQREEQDVRAVMVRLEDVSVLPATGPPPTATPTGAAAGARASRALTGADVVRASYASPSGWLRLQDRSGVIPPRRIGRLSAEDLDRPLFSLDEYQTEGGGLVEWLVAPARDFIPVAADTSVKRAAEWIAGLRAAMPSAGGGGDAGGNVGESGLGGQGGYGDEAIVVVIEKGKYVGFLEVDKLLEEAS